MITNYIAKALERAIYEPIDDGEYCATVRGLRGVIATGATIEECRKRLSEVVEEWVLVRVDQHLPVTKLGGITVRVRRAS